MSDIKGKAGELRCTVQVKRKATGKVETYELIGWTTPEQHEQISGESRKNKVHGASGAVVGPGAGVEVK